MVHRLNHPPSSSSSSSKCEVIRAVLLIFNQSCKPDPEAKLHFLHLICFFEFRETHFVTPRSFICDLGWTRSPDNLRVVWFSSFCLNIFGFLERDPSWYLIFIYRLTDEQLIIFGRRICCFLFPVTFTASVPSWDDDNHILRDHCKINLNVLTPLYRLRYIEPIQHQRVKVKYTVHIL